MKIAVIANEQATGVEEAFPVVCKKLLELGAELVFPTIDCLSAEAVDGIIEEADVAVAMGGDGTIIHVAKRAALLEKAVLGINCGHLGFMAGLEADEPEQLAALLEGRYTVDKRMMLRVRIRSTAGERTFTALNEAVVSRGQMSRMVDLSVYNHGQPVVAYRADGVIVATPTGSTAYSLSAGGPIIDPALKCLLFTPICPHSLRSRPYIFGEDAALSVKASGRGQPAFLTVDGEEGVPVAAEDTVYIEKSDIAAQLIQIKTGAFYDALNRKLMDR